MYDDYDDFNDEPMVTDHSCYAPQERPSLLKRMMALGGAYVIYRNLFSK